VVITEIEPICALQAAMQGYQVTTLEDVIDTGDIFITTAGNKNIIRAQDIARMKHQAIVELTRLTDEQASYLGVHVDGPYKPDHYRY
jgi:adenosylhomocysteinase